MKGGDMNEETKTQEEGHVRPVINHIGVSGGKDSTALLLWALHESGHPKESLDVTFCDTDWEHDATYDHIVLLSEHSVAHGGPKIKWLRPERGFREMVMHEGRFPSPQVRFCTRLLKIVPMKRYIFRLVTNGCNVVLHSGIRASESDERAKMVMREEVSLHIAEYRPLLRWTIDDVWAIHDKYGIPKNRLYGLGARRVGCFPCMMSRKDEIAKASVYAPKRFDEIERMEGPNRNGRSFNTFFEYKKTPKRFRTVATKNKKGQIVMIPTIRDVIRWATEKPDLTQADLFKETNTQAEDRTACQSTWGSCE